MHLQSISIPKGSSFTIKDIPVELPDSYRNFLDKCNGGYASDGYFHFFGLTGPLQHNVISWNQSDWRKWYSLEDSWFIFAEDIFGFQYFIKTKGRKGSIYMLDCFRGGVHFMADSFDNFVRDIVDDPTEEVIAESKKIAKGYFKSTKQNWEPFVHLSHKTPLILGGDERDINNIEVCDSIVNLTILGQLIDQTNKLKPGTIINDIQIDREKLKVKLIY